MNQRSLFPDKKKAAVSYLIAFFLPAILMALAYLTVGVVPGGPKSALLVDGKLQYVAFFSEYIRQLKNFNFPLFSRFLGPGMSFFGTWAYYLASPLNLLALIFSEAHMLDAMYLITLVKIGFCGLSFNVFAQKSLKTEPIPSLLFSTAYALCGTIVYNADNLQWLDGMIWLPIIILCIERIREKGRCVYLPFVIAVLIISNFYAAVLCAPFCVIYVLYVLLRSKREDFAEKRGIFSLRVIISGLIGIGMASFVIIPTFYTLQNEMNLLGQKFPVLELTVNPLLTLEELFFARKGYISYEGLPKIYSSLLSIILLPYFFFEKGIPRRKKLAAAAVLGFLFVVFHFSWLNFFFHGLDRVTWYPFRYGFVFSFFVLLIAAEGFRERNLRLSEKQKTLLIFGSVLLFAYLVPTVIFGLSDERPIAIAIFFLNFALIVTYIVLLDSKKNMNLILCAVLVLELFLNTAYIQRNLDAFAGYSDNEHWKLRTGEIEAIIDKNGLRDSDERTALRVDTITLNDTALFGISGIDFYSSAASQKTAHMLKNMGYLQNLALGFEISDNGGALLSDALLSISGEIVEDSPMGKSPYLPAVFPSRHWTERDTGYEPVYIRHAVTLPKAFFVSDEISNFDSEQAVSGPMDYNDMLLSHMLGRPVITSTELSSVAGFVNATLHNSPGGWSIYIPEDSFEYSNITIELTGRGENVPIYLYCELVIREDSLAETETDISFNVENEGKSFCLKMFDPTDAEFLLSLGAYPEGSPVRVTIPFLGCAPAFHYLRFFSQSETEVEQATAPLQENPIDFRWTDSDSFRLKSRSEAEKIIFISIPFDSGWSAELNGESIEILNLADGFMGIRVPEGEHEIEFSFFPPGLRTGIAVSAFFVIIAAAWLLIRRLKAFRPREYTGKRDVRAKK